MLAIADSKGRVYASVPGLADAARVSIDNAVAALAVLEAPDQWSRDQEHEGRRITEIKGGWEILNYPKYRMIRNEETRRAQVREAVREYRQAEGVVYYVRSGNHVKIGFSTNLGTRLTTLREHNPDLQLIGFETGNLKLEQQRHRELGKRVQDKSPRAGGEWYIVTPEIEAFLTKLAKQSKRPKQSKQKVNPIETEEEKTGSLSGSGAAAPDTYLTPYLDVYRQHIGEPEPGRIAKAVKPVRDELGDEQALALWSRFCASDKAQYGPNYFAANWRIVATGNGKPGRVPQQERSLQAIAAAKLEEPPRG